VERVCFQLKVRPERIDEYRERHRSVWPDMREALRAAGWRNYSLFLREQDGLVVGYCETDDFAATTAAMAREDVSARWEATMSKYFQPAPGDGTDRPRDRLVEYFHLD
jgi:L-rhamnose mutarotase